jgi:hypothetical protein
MKNKKWFWIGMTLFIVAITAAVIGVNYWYHSGTVRATGEKIRVNMEGTGYIFDPQTGEVTGQTPVRVSGETRASDKDMFDGYLEVMGYVNLTDGTVTTTSVISKDDTGFWQIECIENCRHFENGQNGATVPVEHLCDYHYIYYFYPEKQDFLVVMVKDFDEPHPVYVVLADSQEQAEETYKWFMENKPKI